MARSTYNAFWLVKSRDAHPLGLAQSSELCRPKFNTFNNAETSLIMLIKMIVNPSKDVRE